LFLLSEGSLIEIVLVALIHVATTWLGAITISIDELE
jgi:hypothetical protein